MLYSLKKGPPRGYLSHLGLPLHASCISRPSGTSFLRVLGPLWPPLGLLPLSCGFQGPQLDQFLGVCFGTAFLNGFSCYFGWVLDIKSIDFAWERFQKSHFQLRRILDHFGVHFGGHVGPRVDPKSHLDSSWRPHMAILAYLCGM